MYSACMLQRCCSDGMIIVIITFTLCCGNWRTHWRPTGWGGEALALLCYSIPKPVWITNKGHQLFNPLNFFTHPQHYIFLFTRLARNQNQRRIPQSQQLSWVLLCVCSSCCVKKISQDQDTVGVGEEWWTLWMDLVSIFTHIYCCLLNPHYHYILMQPSVGGKQNEEGVLWFHQWTMQAGIKKEEE